MTHQNCYPLLTCCLTQLATRRIVRRGQNNVVRQISMTTRKELVEALQVRYRSAAFSDRIKILDEFVALTGYHRKHERMSSHSYPNQPSQTPLVLPLRRRTTFARWRTDSALRH